MSRSADSSLQFQRFLFFSTAIFLFLETNMTLISLASLAGIAITSAVFLRILYNLYLHPLAKFHGPWYAASFSLIPAIISVLRIEPQWLLSLTKRYGSQYCSCPLLSYLC